MTRGNQTSFRLAILGCSVLLGLQAARMTLSDVLVRTGWSHQNQAAAEALARLGLLDGDFRTDIALSYYSKLAWPLDRGSGQPAARQELEQAQAVAKRALRSSPHEARLWLLLAAFDVQIAQLDQKQSKEAVDALKMAYYTGPNEIKLSPYRLMVAVRPGVLDEELQQLVLNELRMLVTREPQLKPAIVAAYRVASPTAKKLIEDAVSGHDPQLLGSARSEAGLR